LEFKKICSHCALLSLDHLYSDHISLNEEEEEEEEDSKGSSGAELRRRQQQQQRTAAHHTAAGSGGGGGGAGSGGLMRAAPIRFRPHSPVHALLLKWILAVRFCNENF
jgi:hypothetical protein